MWATEIVSLVGPNGAGKTSLLRALSGMASASADIMSFRGKDLRNPRRSSRSSTSASRTSRRAAGSSRPDRSRQPAAAAGAPVTRTSPGWSFDFPGGTADQPGVRHDVRRRAADGHCDRAAPGSWVKPDLIMIDEGVDGPGANRRRGHRRPSRYRGVRTSVLLVEQDIDAALTTTERAYVWDAGRHDQSGRNIG